MQVADSLTRSFYDVEVIDNVPFGTYNGEPNFFALRLTHPGWESSKAGQFVMVRPQGWALDMPFARPFSICRTSSKEIVLFYQVVGSGTRRLATLGRGDRVDLWGPLGTGFHVEGSTPTLLIAGGIGIAPFVGYVQQHPRPAMLSMVFGHRMPEDCYPIETLADRIELENYYETESIDLDWFLKHIDGRIKAYTEQNGLVLACGPKPLLKAVQSMARKHGARAQVSLEESMACGVGACLGCVINTSPSYVAPDDKPHVAGMPVQVCSQGPVFWADQITLES